MRTSPHLQLYLRILHDHSVAATSQLRKMPSLKDILHKRNELGADKPPAQNSTEQTFPASPPAEITLMRSDTFSQEVITPSAYDENVSSPHTKNTDRPTSSTSRRSFQLFRRPSRSPSSSRSPPGSRDNRRLTHLLRLDTRRSRSNSRDSSANIPPDLPQIVDDGGSDKQEREAQWEKRATVLVQQNPWLGQLSSPRQSMGNLSLSAGDKSWSRSSSRSQLADVQEDVSKVGFGS